MMNVGKSSLEQNRKLESTGTFASLRRTQEEMREERKVWDRVRFEAHPAVPLSSPTSTVPAP
eukprot:7819706-Prorocentrum_lima.AAC.1